MGCNDMLLVGMANVNRKGLYVIKSIVNKNKNLGVKKLEREAKTEQRHQQIP